MKTPSPNNNRSSFWLWAILAALIILVVVNSLIASDPLWVWHYIQGLLEPNCDYALPKC